MFKLIVITVLISIFYPTVYSQSRICQKPSITTASGTAAPTGTICPGDLIFQENFDGPPFTKRWEHERTLGGGASNNQFQLYHNNRSNSFVRDGNLHICPTLLADDNGEAFLYNGTISLNGPYPIEHCTISGYDGCLRTGNDSIILNPIKSARIHSAYSFSFKYGRVESRVKVPLGDWLWPALWMKPRNNEYSSWPSSGEIDILESMGNKGYIKNGVNIGVQEVGSTLHWGPYSALNRYPLTHYTLNNADGWNADFHIYEMIWNTTSITFLIDHVVLGSVSPPDGGFWELGNFSTNTANPWAAGTKMAPFDQEFYFIINLAVGSTSWFSDYGVNDGYPKPWKNSDGRASMTKFWKAKDLWLPTWNMTTDDSHFQIDYIRVYAL
ncbi:beta-1,3-glucan-binding protein-like [Diabrotica virgifera virgifera]|uniref:GH16 domain-containing protein n=1 Tax=Diabrotica virgifera virgifera TaxID=50390 RepID=A0ABM5KJJ8_DIAVI|nr:beta-1,3-glucan-binding protein-like [Diabrotica virgifera virgifera]